MCPFLNHRYSDHCCCVCRNDFIFISATPEEMEEVKQSVADRFKMKDIGSLHYCLGVSVIQDEGHIFLYQKQCVLNMIEKYGLTDVYTVSTPSDISVKLVKDDRFSKDVNPKSINLWLEVCSMLQWLHILILPTQWEPVLNLTQSQMKHT